MHLPHRLRFHKRAAMTATAAVAACSLLGGGLHALSNVGAQPISVFADRPIAGFPATMTISKLATLSMAAGPLEALAKPQLASSYAVERVAYHEQKLRLTATLLVPTTPGRHPLVLALHGWITKHYRPGDDATLFAAPLAQNGVLVAIPDYRGLGGGDADPHDMPLPLADAMDSMALLADLRADPRVDARHIGVIGHSLGANVAEVLLAANPSISAAVLYAPSESEAAMLAARRPAFFLGKSQKQLPPLGSTYWRDLSPGQHFRNLGHTTVLLVHGTDDRVIPLAGSRHAAGQLQAAGATVSLKLLPGAGHDITGAAWRPVLNQGTIAMLTGLGLRSASTPADRR